MNRKLMLYFAAAGLFSSTPTFAQTSHLYAKTVSPANPNSPITRLQDSPVSELENGCKENKFPYCDALGTKFLNGRGVARDERRAFSLFSKGCDGGDAGSCNDLATLYGAGVGVARDTSRAASLMMKSCYHRFVIACYNLGESYRIGNGVTRDPLMATTLLSKACNGGIGEGCLKEAQLLATQFGVQSKRQQIIALLHRARQLKPSLSEAETLLRQLGAN